MIFKDWNNLPEFMKCDEVRVYYEILKKRKLSLYIKRVFDVVVALMLIIVLAIPMLIVAIMIKKDSKGPVFYRQERVTAYGKKFKIHKFRTMVSNAEKIGPTVTMVEDSRITQVGAKLRRFRIDEFPQIFDVLLGNMSFVGTRPEAVKYVSQYTNEMIATLLLPAGITSEASIKYKNEAVLLNKADNIDEVYMEDILPEKMKYNLESIRRFSFLGDILIMIKTTAAVIK
jgi:lipopolysaccharide/colanic/teichoic acid biosynthesis glycosyltransferase